MDESPEDALLREFREELSIDVSIIKKAGVWQHTYPFFHVEIHVFLVESSELESIQMSVHSEKKWISSSKKTSILTGSKQTYLLSKIFSTSSIDARLMLPLNHPSLHHHAVALERFAVLDAMSMLQSNRLILILLI